MKNVIAIVTDSPDVIEAVATLAAYAGVPTERRVVSNIQEAEKIAREYERSQTVAM